MIKCDGSGPKEAEHEHFTEDDIPVIINGHYIEDWDRGLLPDPFDPEKQMSGISVKNRDSDLLEFDSKSIEENIRDSNIEDLEQS